VCISERAGGQIVHLLLFFAVKTIKIFELNNIMIKTCEYCGLSLKTNDPNETMHQLCKRLQEFSNGRNLTYANADSYPMSYVPDDKKNMFPSLKPNSRSYCYTHKLVACLLLGRDLISQGEEDSEIIDHIFGNQSKKNFAPWNLRVLNLREHVSSHKLKSGEGREHQDGKSKKKYQKRS